MGPGKRSIYTLCARIRNLNCSGVNRFVHGDMGAQNIMLTFGRDDKDMMDFDKCKVILVDWGLAQPCLLYTSPSPRD